MAAAAIAGCRGGPGHAALGTARAAPTIIHHDGRGSKAPMGAKKLWEGRKEHSAPDAPPPPPAESVAAAAAARRASSRSHAAASGVLSAEASCHSGLRWNENKQAEACARGQIGGRADEGSPGATSEEMTIDDAAMRARSRPGSQERRKRKAYAGFFQTICGLRSARGDQAGCLFT